MSKQKPEVTIRSFGIYTTWESDSKDLPRILEFTTSVPAVVDVEFGLVVNIKRAKNQIVRYCIYHPGILDEHGQRRAPFSGEVYVKSGNWDFFLGDTIWEPISDKIGIWRMTIEIAGKVVAEKTFDLV